MKKTLQRLLSCLLLWAVLACGMTIPASAAKFTDVPAKHWAAADISRCVDLGFFQGETASRFGVGHAMTRSAFTVVLCRFFGWETAKPAKSPYPDVPADAWYAGAVQAARSHGALTDQLDSFRPNDPITREELAVMLVRALGYGPITGLAQELPSAFHDVTTSSGYINLACDLGLMSGTASRTFSPERAATREQVAVILMRLYDKLHQTPPKRLGILTSGDDLPDLTGYDAVALAAGRLIGAGSAKVNSTMAPENAAACQAAVRQAGAKVLLYVLGGPTALNGGPEQTAKALLEAVESGGYAGLLLDIPDLKYSLEDDMTALAKRLDAGLGDKLLYITAESPTWEGNPHKGYDYAALSTSADRLILRIPSIEEDPDSDYPVTPPAPLENLYCAIASLRDTVDSGKLSFLVEQETFSWVNGRESDLSREELLETVTEESLAYHFSQRYACAYLTGLTPENKPVISWYLDGRSMAARTQLAKFFGIRQICLDDIQSLSPEIIENLR